MPGRFLVVGGGGREAAFAARLSEDSEVCAIMPHRNPQIMSCAEKSGGECLIGDSDDPQAVLGFAKKCSADYVFVNADQPLANGVVDLLLENGIRAIGGTKEASRIEWDKIHSIRLTEEACPGFVPFYRVASTAGEADAMIAEFEGRGLKVVVKPRGLTGGKGVKVMPEHLPTYDSCRE